MLPFLLLLVMGIIDFGRALYIQTALQNGAREGARMAIVHPLWVTAADSADPNNIVYRASTEPAATTPASNVHVQCTTSAGAVFDATTQRADYTACAQSGSRIEVRVTAKFEPITPLVGIFMAHGGLTLGGRTRMVIE